MATPLWDIRFMPPVELTVETKMDWEQQPAVYSLGQAAQSLRNVPMTEAQQAGFAVFFHELKSGTDCTTVFSAIENL